MSDMLKLLKIIDKVEKPVAINESVSLNISVSGDGADDVINMMAKLMNPQGGAAHQAMTNLPMVKTLDSVSGYADEAGHAYADEVGEEWENTPDPEVSDVEYMTKDLAGGLNKPKQMVKKEYPGDNPMSVAENIANSLMDEYKKIKEGKLDELSPATLGSYVKKGVRDIANKQYQLGTDPNWKQNLNTRKLMNRRKGVDKAVDKITKENQIDELSTDTYHRAAHKAANKAMWDAEGTSGKKYKKYSAMANKFRAKGMEQEKKEKSTDRTPR